MPSHHYGPPLPQSAPEVTFRFGMLPSRPVACRTLFVLGPLRGCFGHLGPLWPLSWASRDGVGSGWPFFVASVPCISIPWPSIPPRSSVAAPQVLTSATFFITLVFSSALVFFSPSLFFYLLARSEVVASTILLPYPLLTFGHSHAPYPPSLVASHLLLACTKLYAAHAPSKRHPPHSLGSDALASPSPLLQNSQHSDQLTTLSL